MLLVLVAIVSVGNAQNVTKETIEVEGGKKNVTVTEKGLYDWTESKEAAAYYEKAAVFAKNKEFKKAKKFYKKAIKKDPTFVEAYDDLGQIYRRLGEYDEAIIHYKKSIDLYPKGTMAHQNLAIVYGILKDHKAAILEYSTIAKIDPNDPEAYFGIGNSYLNLGQHKEGLIHAHKALGIYKETKSHHIGDGYHLVGLLHYYNEEYKKAKEFLALAKKNGVRLHAAIEKDLFSDDKEEVILEVHADYAKAEKKFIRDYKWIKRTPLGTNPDKRAKISAFLIMWMTGSPKVSIQLSEKVIDYGDCSSCLVVFMSGWAAHVIEIKVDDQFKGALAGTNAVIEYYTANKSTIGTNKNIEKLITLKADNKLAEYIKKNSK